MSEINYRRMKPEEIVRLVEIDREERIRTGYEIRDGTLHKMEVNWDTPAWFTEGDGDHTVSTHITSCRKYFDRGGVMYGAFDGEVLMGIGILQPEIRPGWPNWLSCMSAVLTGVRELGSRLPQF